MRWGGAKADLASLQVHCLPNITLLLPACKHSHIRGFRILHGQDLCAIQRMDTKDLISNPILPWPTCHACNVKHAMS